LETRKLKASPVLQYSDVWKVGKLGRVPFPVFG
jgi:hypothetical protein